MDTIIWSHILYELSLSVSGEQELDKLVNKATYTFLKKLDCAYASILQYKDDYLDPLCVIPRAALNEPVFNEIINTYYEKMMQGEDKRYIVLKKDLNNYGFSLQNFGLFIMGINNPIEEIFLKELLPIISTLAQNCFFALDIAKKQHAIKTELKKERHLLRVILDTIPDLIFYKDMKGVYKVANKAAESFSSLNPKEIIGFTDWDIHSQAEASKSIMMDRKIIESGHAHRFEEQYKHCGGYQVPFEVIKVPVYDTEGNNMGIVGISRDITERKHYEQQLEYTSAHDQLTGLYNRRYLEEKIERLDTVQQLPISIIMGDLNGLKLANDIFGHQEGDNLIIRTAEIIKESCRQRDLIARWGGDEFVIFLPQTGAKSADGICRRIKEKCNSQKSGYLQVGIALGRATKNKTTDSIWQVLKEANERMFSDKYMHAQNYKKAVVSSLRSALLKKSMETEEHAERLKIVCRKIGIKMKLSTSELNKLELLAILHDIGKVAIKKTILMKPGPLTKEEWIQMKKHPEIGYRFARAVPELSPVADYILSHHERWDGKGYPRRIREEDIPLLSRILAVADAFDAMTNDRSYRKAITMKEALTIIKKNAGTQFDPQVVNVFCQLYTAEKDDIQL